MNVWKSINEVYVFIRLYTLSSTMVKLQSKLNTNMGSGQFGSVLER